MVKVLTKNKIEILKIIESFRFLPLGVLVDICIENKIYTKRESISRVIKQLEAQELIGSYMWGNNSKALFIKSIAIKELSIALGLPIYYFTSPSFKDRIQTYGLEHTIEIANIYKKLNSFLKANTEFKIDFWKGDQNVKCFYEKWSLSHGKKVKRVLEPDSYFRISKDEKFYEFFLEYDTGTMFRKQLVEKFSKYFEYMLYGDHKEKYFHFPYIFFITRRASHLMEKMLQVPEDSLETMILSRQKFAKTNHLLFEAVGNSINLNSHMNSEIRDFINHKIIFTYYQSEWEKEILKLLS